MLEVLQFIFSDAWTFLGTCILLYTLSELSHRTRIFSSKRDVPLTFSGLRRQAIKEIIFKDVVNNNDIESKNELVKKKINIVTDAIETAKNKNINNRL